MAIGGEDPSHCESSPLGPHDTCESGPPPAGSVYGHAESSALVGVESAGTCRADTAPGDDCPTPVSTQIRDADDNTSSINDERYNESDGAHTPDRNDNTSDNSVLGDTRTEPCGEALIADTTVIGPTAFNATGPAGASRAASDAPHRVVGIRSILARPLSATEEQHSLDWKDNTDINTNKDYTRSKSSRRQWGGVVSHVWRKKGKYRTPLASTPVKVHFPENLEMGGNHANTYAQHIEYFIQKGQRGRTSSDGTIIPNAAATWITDRRSRDDYFRLRKRREHQIGVKRMKWDGHTRITTVSYGTPTSEYSERARLKAERQKKLALTTQAPPAQDGNVNPPAAPNAHVEPTEHTSSTGHCPQSETAKGTRDTEIEPSVFLTVCDNRTTVNPMSAGGRMSCALTDKHPTFCKCHSGAESTASCLMCRVCDDDDDSGSDTDELPHHDASVETETLDSNKDDEYSSDSDTSDISDTSDDDDDFSPDRLIPGKVAYASLGATARKRMEHTRNSVLAFVDSGANVHTVSSAGLLDPDTIESHDENVAGIGANVKSEQKGTLRSRLTTINGEKFGLSYP